MKKKDSDSSTSIYLKQENDNITSKPLYDACLVVILGKEENKKLVLKKLHLISEGNITNAGIILFGKNPSKFFENNLS